MKTLLKSIFAVTLLLAGIQWIQAQEKVQPEIYAVVFHADWCSSCKAIAPSIAQLKADLKNKPVEFVKFDFTSDDAKTETKKVAGRLGLENILEANNGTGFVILVDAKTKKEVARLNRRQSEKEMLAVVTKYLC